MSDKFSQYDDGDLLDAVLSWADTKAEFDPEFVDSLAQSYEKHGVLSEKQRAALCSIIEKWEVPI